MRCLCLLFVVLLSGCGLLPDAPGGAKAPAPAPPSGAMTTDLLKPGDGVHIAVAGERELSGTFAVAANGTVHLELLGEVAAAGLTPQMLAQDLRRRLAAGYLRDPQVTVMRAQPAGTEQILRAGTAAPPPLNGSLAGAEPPAPPPPQLRRSQDVTPAQ